MAGPDLIILDKRASIARRRFYLFMILAGEFGGKVAQSFLPHPIISYCTVHQNKKNQLLGFSSNGLKSTGVRRSNDDDEKVFLKYPAIRKFGRRF